MKKIYLLPLITLFFGFNGLIKSATFTSVSSGTWSAPATWSVTGVDADGIPDLDDDVTINAGHTIDLSVSINAFRTLVISGSGILRANGRRLHAHGDFTNNGSLIGVVSFQVYSNCVLNSSTTLTNGGDWYVRNGTLTISSNTIIRKSNFFYINAGGVINHGSYTLTGGSLIISSVWRNEVGSFLQVAGGGLSSSGILDASALSNTVAYSGKSTIKATTYYNLSLLNLDEKTLLNNTTVLNDFTLEYTFSSNNNRLNMNFHNLTIGGNWSNLVNTTILNQGVITFNGSGNQLITRSATEQFNNLVINSTGTVTLGRAINVSQSLTIQNGTLDVSPSNFQINIQGNLTNNGLINTRAGIINFNGSNAQTVSGTSPIPFYNLVLNNVSGLIFNSGSTLSNALTVSNGNFNSNGNFTLLSDASSTARIAPVGSGGSFSGQMIIRKFISARSTFTNTPEKAYHDLSSPVQNTTIMDWDDEIYMSGIGPNDGIPGPAGVDGSSPMFPSSYVWDEPSVSYIPITGSNFPIESGKTYHIWLADNLSAWNAKAIDTRGVPTFGNNTVNLSFTSNAGGYGGLYDGLNAIGNPYASAINYSACVKTNMVSGIQMLNGSGNYAEYSDNVLIPSCQGFVVQAAGPGASVMFTESSKSTSTTSLFYRGVSDYAVKLIYSSPSNQYYNENTIKFNINASAGFDKGIDAVYLKSPIEGAAAMYMAIGEKGGLITNAISPDEDEVTIPLSLFTPSKGIYYIESSVLNTASYSKVWIEHVKTGKKYDLKDGSIAIEGDENETNKNYVLRFSKSAENNTISQAAFENDLVVFNIENALILKANSSNHLVTSLSIYDLSGKLIMDYSDVSVVVGSTMEFDISNLAKGLYIVNAIDSNNHLITKKIVK